MKFGDEDAEIESDEDDSDNFNISKAPLNPIGRGLTVINIDNALNYNT
jgi:hypothetical protein